MLIKHRTVRMIVLYRAFNFVSFNKNHVLVFLPSLLSSFFYFDFQSFRETKESCPGTKYPYGRKGRGTTKPLDESESGE